MRNLPTKARERLTALQEALIVQDGHAIDQHEACLQQSQGWWGGTGFKIQASLQACGGGCAT
jgi:hypothetical protein